MKLDHKSSLHYLLQKEAIFILHKQCCHMRNTKLLSRLELIFATLNLQVFYQIAHLATLISKQKPSQKKLLFSSYKQIGDEGISDVPSLFASGAFQLFNTMQHYIISRDNIRCVSFRINHFECLVNGIFSKFSSFAAAEDSM